MNTTVYQLFKQHPHHANDTFSALACSIFIRKYICITTCSPDALPHPPFVFTVSQSNSSLKKQRSRSIFSTFFCCFRNYNADPPASSTNTNSLPPPVEENGSPPKVSSCTTTRLCLSIKSITVFYVRCSVAQRLFLWIVLSLCFFLWILCLFSFLSSHLVFVCLSLLCCSVTRSRSSLFLVYV